MDRESIFDGVKRAFLEVFDYDQIDETSVPDDVEQWDSMGHLSLVSELEDEFNISITVSESMRMASVSDIIDIVLEKV